MQNEMKATMEERGSVVLDGLRQLSESFNHLSDQRRELEKRIACVLEPSPPAALPPAGGRGRGVGSLPRLHAEIVGVPQAFACRFGRRD